MIKIKTALLSVYDKTDLEVLARFLTAEGVKLISSGGTATFLREKGIEVTEVSEITGFPEMLNGRVKTLHPKIHGGILAERKEEHLRQLRDNGIETVDLVVVNLYPFEKVKEESEDPATLIENIDIGGPTLLRAGAKNHRYVCVLPDPALYGSFMDNFSNGGIDEQFARMTAVKTFAAVSYYDSLISGVFANLYDLPLYQTTERLTLPLKKEFELRYGENPSQKALLYKDGMSSDKELSIVNCKQLWGKELSFNNYMDLDSALKMTVEFTRPFAVILKHTNPCGAAVAPTIEEAFDKALEGDPKSAFGGIIGINRKVTSILAKKITSSFFECVVAPYFTEKAMEILKKKKNLRILQWPEEAIALKYPRWDVKKISGGFLLQETDTSEEPAETWELKTGAGAVNSPEAEFAWKMVKHVKSNAIVLAKDGKLVGVGAGQMSRVDAVNNAIAKAKEFGVDLQGAVLASDAFFPFADSLESAHEEGINIIIEPGGSVRDEEVINKARELGMTLYFTKRRHFKH